MTPLVVRLIGHAHSIIPAISQAGKVAATGSHVIAAPARGLMPGAVAGHAPASAGAPPRPRRKPRILPHKPSAGCRALPRDAYGACQVMTQFVAEGGLFLLRGFPEESAHKIRLPVRCAGQIGAHPLSCRLRKGLAKVEEEPPRGRAAWRHTSRGAKPSGSPRYRGRRRRLPPLAWDKGLNHPSR